MSIQQTWCSPENCALPPLLLLILPASKLFRSAIVAASNADGEQLCDGVAVGPGVGVGPRPGVASILAPWPCCCETESEPEPPRVSSSCGPSCAVSTLPRARRSSVAQSSRPGDAPEGKVGCGRNLE